MFFQEIFVILNPKYYTYHMKNIYYNQVVQLLTGRPEGMKLCNIARQVYNANNDLFADEDLYRQIYTQLKRFLWVQSRKKNSPFMACKKWGYYGIRNSYAVQFELPFDDFQYDIIEPKRTAKVQKPEMPNLFGW